MRSPQTIRLGKLSGEFNMPSESTHMVPAFKEFLKASNYDIGGIKETYRHWQSECVDLVKDEHIDFRVFILRNPIYNFSGWKRSQSAEDFDVHTFVENHISFIERIKIKSLKTPSYIIKYESLCSFGTEQSFYNKVFEGLLSFNAPPKLASTGYVYGDRQANQSLSILSARTDSSNLSAREVELCAGLVEKYDELGLGLIE